jgi:hypothetical protein
MIARGNTPENCTKRVNQLKKDGWTPISDVKIDPSPTIDLSWVCVLEKPGEIKKDRKSPFNKSYFGEGR